MIALKLFLGVLIFPLVVMGMVFLMTMPLYLWEYSTKSILLFSATALNSMLFILAVPFLKVVLEKKNIRSKILPFVYGSIISYIMYCLLSFGLKQLVLFIHQYYVVSFMMTFLPQAIAFFLFIMNWALFDKLTNSKLLSGIK